MESADIGTFAKTTLTPKQQYEQRKAARKARDGSSSAEKELEMMDILDRFTTAVERIADALERR